MKSPALKMLFSAAFIMIFGVACQKTTPPPGGGGGTTPVTRTPPTPRGPSTFDNHWKKTHPINKGTGKINPQYGRKALRLSVDQLKRSIPLLFNGITWVGYDSRTKKNTANMFDRLSKTLGKADYLQLTQNIREPTALFMKFMDDMAGNVCNQAIARDAKTLDRSKRTVMRYKDIDQNLRFLRLKFHAIHVPNTTTKGIEALRKLYDSILAKKKSVDIAWKGVCIAVLTSPEFFAY